MNAGKKIERPANSRSFTPPSAGVHVITHIDINPGREEERTCFHKKVGEAIQKREKKPEEKKKTICELRQSNRVSAHRRKLNLKLTREKKREGSGGRVNHIVSFFPFKETPDQTHCKIRKATRPERRKERAKKKKWHNMNHRGRGTGAPSRPPGALRANAGKQAPPSVSQGLLSNGARKGHVAPGGGGKKIGKILEPAEEKSQDPKGGKNPQNHFRKKSTHAERGIVSASQGNQEDHDKARKKRLQQKRREVQPSFLLRDEISYRASNPAALIFESTRTWSEEEGREGNP